MTLPFLPIIHSHWQQWARWWFSFSLSSLLFPIAFLIPLTTCLDVAPKIILVFDVSLFLLSYTRNNSSFHKMMMILFFHHIIHFTNNISFFCNKISSFFWCSFLVDDGGQKLKGKMVTSHFVALIFLPFLILFHLVSPSLYLASVKIDWSEFTFLLFFLLFSPTATKKASHLSLVILVHREVSWISSYNTCYSCSFLFIFIFTLISIFFIPLSAGSLSFSLFSCPFHLLTQTKSQTNLLQHSIFHQPDSVEHLKWLKHFLPFSFHLKVT